MIPLAGLLPLVRSAAPVIVAAGLGWSAAWYVQGLRLQSARTDLLELRQQHTAAVLAAQEKAHALTDETARAWAQNLDALRRARAAGWVPVVPAADRSASIPDAGRPDAAGADTVLAAAGSEACRADLATVTADAQQTTLMLNQLQAAIEAQ